MLRLYLGAFWQNFPLWRKRSTSLLPNLVGTSHKWLLSTWDVASESEENLILLNFNYFALSSHVTSDYILDFTAHFFLFNLRMQLQNFLSLLINKEKLLIFWRFSECKICKGGKTFHYKYRKIKPKKLISIYNI